MENSNTSFRLGVNTDAKLYEERASVDASQCDREEPSLSRETAMCSRRFFVHLDYFV